MHCAFYLTQFVLGLSQRSLFLCQLRRGSIQLGPLWLHHPEDTSVDLEDKWSLPLIFVLGVCMYESTFVCVTACSCTSIALTHMHRDLAARETLPMISGWKSTCLQYWPIFFNTRSDILSLSKLTRVLMKLDSPAKKHYKVTQIRIHEHLLLFLCLSL